MSPGFFVVVMSHPDFFSFSWPFLEKLKKSAVPPLPAEEEMSARQKKQRIFHGASLFFNFTQDENNKLQNRTFYIVLLLPL